MGVAERKERQKLELRRLIIEAARAIVLAEGFDALTMRKIADVIEYAPGTIYLHFASRDDIALELVREGFNELLGFFAPCLRIADPLERVDAIGRAYVEFGLTHPQTYRLIFMENPKFSNEVLAQSDYMKANPDEPGALAFNALLSTCEELVAQGIAKPADPQQLSYLLWSVVHGIVSLQLVCSKAAYPDARAMTEVALATLKRGLLA